MFTILKLIINKELMKLSLTLCMLGNFVCVFVTLVNFLKDFPKKLNLKKKISRHKIKFKIIPSIQVECLYVLTG